MHTNTRVKADGRKEALTGRHPRCNLDRRPTVCTSQRAPPGKAEMDPKPEDD